MIASEGEEEAAPEVGREFPFGIGAGRQDGEDRGRGLGRVGRPDIERRPQAFRGGVDHDHHPFEGVGGRSLGTALVHREDGAGRCGEKGQRCGSRTGFLIW